MEEFVKEASEVPNFLEEVDECRKICSSPPRGEKHQNTTFLSLKWTLLQ